MFVLAASDRTSRPGPDDPGAFLVVAKGVMTCGETCCHFIANRQGSDTTNYLDELCLTPSALTLKLERR